MYKYILSIEQMVGGKPMHEKPQVYDTEDEAIMCMKGEINHELNNYLELDEFNKWDYDMTRKARIDVKIGFDEAKIVWLDNPLENYSYYYVDKVEIG